MGFDIYGLSPLRDEGKHYQDKYWWRPMQALVFLTCADILTAREMRELGFKDGYAYNAEKAAAIASRLASIAADEKLLAKYENQLKALLPEAYACWSDINILEFVEFLQHSGGFEVF
jgi:hypothetical protein